jgi:hypothetical protein
MRLLEFHFGDACPSQEELTHKLQVELGARRCRRIEDIEIIDTHTIRITSMDIIALAYAKKVCLQLRGVSRRSNTPAPSWTSIRWQDHTWISKMKIRLGLIKF